MRRHPSTPSTLEQDADKVVTLPVEPAPDPEPESTPTPPPSGLHTVAVTGMALSAFVGIFSMLVFITIRWPDDLGRYVTGVFIASIVAFLLSASLAVASAAGGSRGVTSVVPRDDDPQ